MTDTIIRCEKVVKQYYRYRHRTTSLRELFIHIARRQPIHERAARVSVKDFSLEISKGEAVALIGPNGSGKSTVLRLMAGIYAPTSGFIETWGRLTAVIELGAGFNVELTGAENISLYGAIMGLSRQQISDRFPEIIEFANIGSYISEPVKYYSSGMQARLAFAVAVCANPEILLIDEVLAVGDEAFRAKCIHKIRRFLAQGGTLVVVSHDLDMMSTLCPRGIWLDNGQIQMDRAIDDVIAAYRAKPS